MLKLYEYITINKYFSETVSWLSLNTRKYKFEIWFDSSIFFSVPYFRVSLEKYHYQPATIIKTKKRRTFVSGKHWNNVLSLEIGGFRGDRLIRLSGCDAVR